MLCLGKPDVQRSSKNTSRESVDKIGPSERFIGGNEDVVGVQVDVSWLSPVSVMDLVSRLAIDCAAHDLVFLLFFTPSVCQTAT